MAAVQQLRIGLPEGEGGIADVKGEGAGRGGEVGLEEEVERAVLQQPDREDVEFRAADQEVVVREDGGVVAPLGNRGAASQPRDPSSSSCTVRVADQTSTSISSLVVAKAGSEESEMPLALIAETR